MNFITKCSVLAVLSLAALGLAAQGKGSAKKAEPIPGTATTSEVEQLRNEVTTQRQMIEELKATVQQLAKQQQASSEQANALTNDVTVVQKQATQAQALATEANAKAAKVEVEVKVKGPSYIEHKKNTTATFITRGGEITGYGNLDVSVDGTTKDTGSLNLERQQCADRQFRLDARHRDQQLLSRRTWLPKGWRASLQLRVSVGSRIRNFSDARIGANQQQPEKYRQRCLIQSKHLHRNCPTRSGAP